MNQHISKKTLFILLLLFSLFTLVTGCIDQSQNSNSNQPSNDHNDDDKLDFSFTLLDGQSRELHDYYGTVLLIDFMGVNCQPCQLEMFELKKVSENYTRDQVNIISINVWISSGETAGLTQQLIDAYEDQVGIILDWTFGIDDSYGTIANEYASEGVPTLYILDPQGNIYYTHVGYEEYSTLKNKIDNLL